MTKKQTKEIAVQENNVVDEKTLNEYLFGLENNLNDKQKNLFLNIAKANNLNPFKREIYAVWFGNMFSIITGYQVYIDKANASNKLDGWNVDVVYNEEWKIKGAKIVIHRKDWEHPFEWEVSIKEFVRKKKNGEIMKNWKTMPELMIKKVAIWQGFRLCFPSEIWGLPYLAEEITEHTETQVIEWEIIEEKKTVEEKADKILKEENKDKTNGEKYKLPTNKVKQVVIKWSELAEISGRNKKESERKRKATMKKLYLVDSTNDLTPEWAEDFLKKINLKIEEEKETKKDK